LTAKYCNRAILPTKEVMIYDHTAAKLYRTRNLLAIEGQIPTDTISIPNCMAKYLSVSYMNVLMRNTNKNIL